MHKPNWLSLQIAFHINICAKKRKSGKKLLMEFCRMIVKLNFNQRNECSRLWSVFSYAQKSQFNDASQSNCKLVSFFSRSLFSDECIRSMVLSVPSVYTIITNSIDFYSSPGISNQPPPPPLKNTIQTYPKKKSIHSFKRYSISFSILIG